MGNLKLYKIIDAGGSVVFVNAYDLGHAEQLAWELLVENKVSSEISNVRIMDNVVLDSKNNDVGIVDFIDN